MDPEIPTPPNISQANLVTATANDPSIAKGPDPAVVQSTQAIPGDAIKTGFNPFGLTNDQSAAAAKVAAATAKAGSQITQQTANSTGGPGGSPFDAIYGIDHMNMPGTGLTGSSTSTIGSAPAALSAVNFAPPPALATQAPANTQINPIGASMTQGPAAGISDRRAKTNIKSAKRDVYSFFEALKVIK